MSKKEILFGRNLQILRSRHNISQQDLADTIHVTRQSISAWERGLGKPDIYSLHDICNYFGISTEKILYERAIEINRTISAETTADENSVDTLVSCANEFVSKGLCTITDEDLDILFGIIRYEFETIMALALSLHKNGYVITEVFANGFSVYLRSDYEATQFVSTLKSLLDNIIHHDNEYIEEKRCEIQEIMYKAYNSVIDGVLTEIYGKNIKQFAFYWADEEENIRGYANTEDECREQAKIQECDNYFILPLVQ